jgi:hypothetical protein
MDLKLYGLTLQFWSRGRRNLFSLAPSREALLLRSIVRTRFQFVVLTPVAVEENDLLCGLVLRLHRGLASLGLRQFPATGACYLGQESIQPRQRELIKLRTSNGGLVFKEQMCGVVQFRTNATGLGALYHPLVS